MSLYAAHNITNYSHVSLIRQWTQISTQTNLPLETHRKWDIHHDDHRLRHTYCVHYDPVNNSPRWVTASETPTWETLTKQKSPRHRVCTNCMTLTSNQKSTWCYLPIKWVNDPLETNNLWRLTRDHGEVQQVQERSYHCNWKCRSNQGNIFINDHPLGKYY